MSEGQILISRFFRLLSWILIAICFFYVITTYITLEEIYIRRIMLFLFGGGILLIYSFIIRTMTGIKLYFSFASWTIVGITTMILILRNY